MVTQGREAAVRSWVLRNDLIQAPNRHGTSLLSSIFQHSLPAQR